MNTVEGPTGRILDDRQAAASVQPVAPELLTACETIKYLRLDVDDRNPGERLRNLVRRQGLPTIRRGKLRLFRRSAIDAWLDGSASGHRTSSPARMPTGKRLTSRNGAARQ